MARSQDSYPAHLVFGVIFGIIAVVALIGLIMVNTQADNISQTASVDNETPTIGTISVAASSQGAHDSSLSLSGDLSGEAATSTIYVWAELTDLNGCRQIEAQDGDGAGGDASSSFVASMIYREGFLHTTNVGGDCTSDWYRCLDAAEGNGPAELLSGCNSDSDTTIDFETSFDVPYFIDATDSGSAPDYNTQTWRAYIEVEDDIGALATSSRTFEIETLKALNVPQSIAYGNVALSASSSAQNVVITNTGNFNTLAPQISQASDWSCDFGTIDKGKTVYASDAPGVITGFGDWRDYVTSASASATTLHNFTVAKSTDFSSSTGQVGAVLDLESGVVAGGSCTSTLTFTAN